MIASAGWDGATKLWDYDGSVIQTLAQGGDRLNAVAFSPDSQYLATVGREEILRLWQRGADGRFSNQPQVEAEGHTDNIWDVAFSPDGPLVATGSNDGTVKLWSLEGELLQTLEGHRDRVHGITFIPANSELPQDWGTVIASASWDRTIKLWSLDGTLRLTLEGHNERVLDLAFHPATETSGPLLASSGLDDIVILWELDQVIDDAAVLQHGCRWVQDYLRLQDERGTAALCDGVSGEPVR